jgi:hypothetical protein
MKQDDNSIDMFLKSGLESVNIDLNKDKSWEKLSKKRTIQKVKHISFAAAAVFIIGFLLITPEISHKNEKSKMSEFQKRQKLKEYENKISGTYIETLFCFNCSGEILESQTKQVPEDQWILQTY